MKPLKKNLELELCSLSISFFFTHSLFISDLLFTQKQKRKQQLRQHRSFLWLLFGCRRQSGNLGFSERNYRQTFGGQMVKVGKNMTNGRFVSISSSTWLREDSIALMIKMASQERRQKWAKTKEGRKKKFADHSICWNQSSEVRGEFILLKLATKYWTRVTPTCWLTLNSILFKLCSIRFDSFVENGCGSYTLLVWCCCCYHTVRATTYFASEQSTRWRPIYKPTEFLVWPTTTTEERKILTKQR